MQIFYELIETYKVFGSADDSIIVMYSPFFRQTRGVGLYIAHLKPVPRDMFERAGVVELLGEQALCKDVAGAMALVEQAMRER